MSDVELKRAAGLGYREALPDGPEDAAPVLLVHGFPQSSYMWRHLMPALAASGRRAIAPDLIGYGDTPPDPPATWERHVETLERFRDELELERIVLVNHDWGGLISMRWALQHSVRLTGLVMSNTGFFPDGEWYGMGAALRTPGQGEALVDSISREGLAAMLGQIGTGFDDRAVDEYWKGFATEDGRRGMLELYRSGDFEKLEPYEGKLGKLTIPIMVLWGENDEYAPLTSAHRFDSEIPDAKLVIVEGSGHFVWEDDPERCAREVIAFLDGTE
ncbi:MAG: alpha/beta fold hydrolase [Actinomycetota bacterium]